MQYIWQLPAWQQGTAPAFRWREEALRPQLERVRLQQGRLLGQSESLSTENQAAHLDALVQTALRTSEIEGEKLDAASVRSSVVRHLGLEQAVFVGTPKTEALVKLLIDASSNIHQARTANPVYACFKRPVAQRCAYASHLWSPRRSHCAF